MTVAALSSLALLSLAPPAPDWSSILDKSGNRITYGVSLKGPSPYERNDETAFTPASNSKLYTTGAALERLGADAVFTTTLEWTDVVSEKGAVSGVTLRGAGDPSFDVSRIGLIADALKSSGATAVIGPITIAAADERWNALRYPEGWTDSDRTSCDGALAQAFNLQLNCATYVVTAAGSGHWVEPGVPVTVNLVIGTDQRTSIEVSALEPEGQVSRSFLMSGTMRPGAGAVTFRLPVHDTAGWVRNLFIDALRSRGIALRPADAGAGAAGATHRLEFTSPRLADILKPFLKKSLNVVGDALLKSLGSRAGPAASPDLLDAGLVVLREFVGRLGSHAAEAIGIAPQPGFFSPVVELFDGSGMSHSSHLTTDAMMALLLDLRARPDFAAVWDALPIAGVDGTLEHRMKNTAAQGLLRAKTGTLNGAYNLSGYVPREDEGGKIAEYVPFVILTRTTSGNELAAHQAEDRIGAALTLELDPSKKPPAP